MSDKIAVYLVREVRDTSPGHPLATIECECGKRFTRRPKRWRTRTWTRCPKCQYKLIYGR